MRVMAVNKKIDSASGYTSEIYKIQKVDNRYLLVDTKGIIHKDSTHVNSFRRRQAFNTNSAICGYVDKAGKQSYRIVNISQYEKMLVKPIHTDKAEAVVEVATDHESVKSFIHNESYALKPKTLIMSELKWKYLIRSAVRARNIMMTGPAGSGKTMAAKALVKALNRPFFYFNLGSTQDPRAALIGNTHFAKDSGTFFSESTFVTAIKTPFAIILLDELSRAHPEAWNILMSVIDQTQRYLRLDEAVGSPIINVAEGVTFVATANIGNEYTSTRVLDRALMDRFVNIEVDSLNAAQELELLSMLYPEADNTNLKAIADIVAHTREQVKIEMNKITIALSTRVSVEMAGLIYDGFNLLEAAEVAIFPYYSQDGGLESERTYIKQLVQKYMEDLNKTALFGNTATSTGSTAATAEPANSTASPINW